MSANYPMYHHHSHAGRAHVVFHPPPQKKTQININNARLSSGEGRLSSPHGRTSIMMSVWKYFQYQLFLRCDAGKVSESPQMTYFGDTVVSVFSLWFVTSGHVIGTGIGTHDVSLCAYFSTSDTVSHNWILRADAEQMEETQRKILQQITSPNRVIQCGCRLNSNSNRQNHNVKLEKREGDFFFFSPRWNAALHLTAMIIIFLPEGADFILFLKPTASFCYTHSHITARFLCCASVQTCHALALLYVAVWEGGWIDR